MGQFKFIKRIIPGIISIETKAFADERGFFIETYNKGNFDAAELKAAFIQDNLSLSGKGVVRGLHYQINPSPTGKLVRCIQGRVFDVGVDVRKGSSTFGQWYGEELSGENKKMIYFPPGIAHGFLCLEDNTYVYYKCTGLYSPKDERALVWDDPEVGIKWPLEQVGEVIVSDRDKAHPGLKNVVKF